MASGSTPLYGIPYPLSTDLVNVHSDLLDMATSIENIFGIFNVSLVSPNIWTNRNTFQTSSTDPTVKITQAGSGHAFVVEDTASDPSPFIIDNAGNVVIGKSTAATAKLDVVGNIALTGSITFPGNINVSAPSVSGSIAVNPMTAAGDMIFGGASGAQTRLPAASSVHSVLMYDAATSAPKWTDTVENLTLNLPNIFLDNAHSVDTGHITWDDPTRTIKVGDGARVLTFFPFEVNTVEITSNYTFVTNDANKLHIVNGQSGPTQVTVPLDSDINYPVGTQISIVALSSSVSVGFAVGVTGYFSPGTKLRAPGSMATLIKLGADKWVLTGDLTA